MTKFSFFNYLRIKNHLKPLFSIKQTRNPPPERVGHPPESPKLIWRQKTTADKTFTYNSPDYTKNREATTKSSQRGRDLFSQSKMSKWKSKQPEEPEATSDDTPVSFEPTRERVLHKEQNQNETHIGHAQTLETVMEELQEVTRQYLSVPDPVEAAARKQRVLASDANGLMEETAARIVAASTAHQALPKGVELLDSNPNTPPPLQENNLQGPLYSDPVDRRNSHEDDKFEEEVDLDPFYCEVSPTKGTLAPKRRSENPAKMKSIIISPSNNRDLSLLLSQEEQVQPPVMEEDETLKEFQNKVQRKPRNQAKNKSPRRSPNILYGLSLKKRNLSQIHNSSSNARELGKTPSKKAKKKGNSRTEAGPSKAAQNPPIKLIPAMARGKSDFRVPPPQAP